MNNPEDSKDEDTKSPIPNNQNDGNDLDDNKTSEHPRDEDDPDESQDNKILAIWEEHKEVRAAIKSKRRIRQKTEAERISQSLTATQKRAMELAQRKGASSVYTTLPLTKYGFSFARKRDFRDLIRMPLQAPHSGPAGRMCLWRIILARPLSNLPNGRVYCVKTR